MGLQTERVGRGGFRGSEITDWCDECQDFVIRMNNGECGWCYEMPASAPRKNLRAERKQHRRNRDAEILKWHKRGMSSRQIGQMLPMDPSGVRKRLAKIQREQLERVAA